MSGERVSLRDIYRGLAWAALRRSQDTGDLATGLRDWFTWLALAFRTPPDVMVPADSEQTTWNTDENGEQRRVQA
jgi:hypothetical protein